MKVLRAEVFVNIPVKRVAQAYSYRVPNHLSCVGPGWRVVVPFGGRRVEGFVVQVSSGEEDERLKEVIAAVDDEAWFTPQMIETSRRLSDFYLCPTAEIMRLFMPGKSGVKIEVRYEPEAAASDSQLWKVATYRQVYEAVCGAGVLGAQELRQRLPELSGSISEILDTMLRRRWLRKTYETKKRAAERYVEILRLAGEPTEDQRKTLRRAHAQLRLLDVLSESGGGVDIPTLLKQGYSRPVIRALAKTGLAEISRVRDLRNSYRGMKAAAESLPPLSQAQEAALSAILPAVESEKTQGFLLHGVTGSGKTRVYLETVAQVRKRGKQAIVLVPEIALTGQLVQAFRAMYAEDVIVIHSRLSVAERNDAFFRIRRGDAGIIVGARSALFTPAADIGVIIMDEEQDMSYKQDDAPRYHARVVAEVIARLHGAVLILGSATPSMETFFRARFGEFVYLSMPERIGGRPLPVVGAVDMRTEFQMGNRKVLSRAVQKMLRETKERGEQAILLLNRRGYSTFVKCRSCGYVVVCPECGISMAYHKDGRMLCHHCDIHAAPPDVCPQCGSTSIRYFGTGTEKLETEIKDLLPEMRVVRMDRDTTQKKFAHTEILQAFRSGEYDILMGTQMVAKGHDIPNVTAVGVISADASLNMPDFRAAERCFMLITQAAGRAGRGNAPGRVLVQCYTPEHYAVHFAIAQDYQSFYEKELEMRRMLFFPPFCRLIKLTFHDENGEKARAEAELFRNRFVAAFDGDENHRLIGPAPAMVEKFRGVYRFDVLIKTAELPKAQEFLREEGLHLRQDVWIDIDPISA